MLEGTPAPVSGTSAPVTGSPLPAPAPPQPKPEPTDRFAYYALAVQAVISIVALVFSFWLIVQPTEAGINTSAFNIIVFIIGVWLGRGVDYGIGRVKNGRT